jgi:hypothetical protein
MDPCSAWTAMANKRVQFGYGLNYMIDVEHAVIFDVEATPARTYDEVAATRTMIDRTEKVFGAKPERPPPIPPREPVRCLPSCRRSRPPPSPRRNGIGLITLRSARLMAGFPRSAL